MLAILRKMKQYPRLTAAYPKQPFTGSYITGQPLITAVKCDYCGVCAERCPAGAIVCKPSEKQIGINLDQCLFCSLCATVCPNQAVTISNNFELATTDRQNLRAEPLHIREDQVPDLPLTLLGREVSIKTRKIFGRSLQIREVDAGSCNACDNEANALTNPMNDIERLGVHFVASPRHADMLLVTGPVARQMELALIKTYNATPDPKLVVAVGACACSGGIFRNSYACRGGVDQVLPVDVYIPGCPPRPQAIIYGILMAVGRIKK